MASSYCLARQFGQAVSLARQFERDCKPLMANAACSMGHVMNKEDSGYNSRLIAGCTESCLAAQ